MATSFYCFLSTKSSGKSLWQCRVLIGMDVYLKHLKCWFCCFLTAMFLSLFMKFLFCSGWHGDKHTYYVLSRGFLFQNMGWVLESLAAYILSCISCKLCLRWLFCWNSAINHILLIWKFHGNIRCTKHVVYIEIWIKYSSFMWEMYKEKANELREAKVI